MGFATPFHTQADPGSWAFSLPGPLRTLLNHLPFSLRPAPLRQSFFARFRVRVRADVDAGSVAGSKEPLVTVELQDYYYDASGESLGQVTAASQLGDAIFTGGVENTFLGKLEV